MKKTPVLVALMATLILASCSRLGGNLIPLPQNRSSQQSPSQGTIQVVAAENFYGDLVHQLGGVHVSVVSILNNPNLDPHEYETSMDNAKAVYAANLVIENGAGYDTWMDKLLSASPNPRRKVIVAASIASHPLTENAHVWYGLENIQSIAQAITDALSQLDGQDAAIFKTNLDAFKASLQPLQQKQMAIKTRYAGAQVGLTETIFLYQTEAMGLTVLTPLNFQKAIAEGNDPPASSVVTALDQISQKQIKVLIYNAQTVTPITANLLDEAQQSNIPIVPITETMPENKSYQQWMLDQLTALQQALGG